MPFPFNSKSIRSHKSVDVPLCVLSCSPNTFLCQVWHRSGSEQAVPVSGWVSGHPSIPLLCSRRSERPPHWGAALHAGRCSLSTQHTWKGMVHFPPPQLHFKHRCVTLDNGTYDPLWLVLCLMSMLCLTGQCELTAACVRGVSEERSAGCQLWLCPPECSHSHGLLGQTSGQKRPQGQTYCGQAHHCTLYTFTAGTFAVNYFHAFPQDGNRKCNTSSHMVCLPSSGPRVCCQLFTSFSPCHQGGCCRNRKEPAAAAAGERQVCREKGSSVRTGRPCQRSRDLGTQTARHHDHADWCHPG